jgi:hypothetical protein
LQPFNTTTDCWILCFFQTLLARDPLHLERTTGGVPVTADEIKTAWLAAFASDDPAQGGCPPVLDAELNATLDEPRYATLDEPRYATLDEPRVEKGGREEELEENGKGEAAGPTSPTLLTNTINTTSACTCSPWSGNRGSCCFGPSAARCGSAFAHHTCSSDLPVCCTSDFGSACCPAGSSCTPGCRNSLAGSCACLPQKPSLYEVRLKSLLLPVGVPMVI